MKYCSFPSIFFGEYWISWLKSILLIFNTVAGEERSELHWHDKSQKEPKKFETLKHVYLLGAFICWCLWLFVASTIHDSGSEIGRRKGRIQAPRKKEQEKSWLKEAVEFYLDQGTCNPSPQPHLSLLAVAKKFDVKYTTLWNHWWDRTISGLGNHKIAQFQST